MKNLSKNTNSVLQKIKKAEAVIFMFDFDGTLSPIASIPKDAILPVKTKKILIEFLKYSSIAIVSGRNLENIKSKVNIKSIIYAGSHGLEWQIGKRKKSVKISTQAIRLLAETKQKFKILSTLYSGLFVEEKKMGFSIHYRKVPIKVARNFLLKSKEITIFAQKTGLLKVFKGKKVLEIRPKVNWDKGEFVKFLNDYLNKKYKKIFLPIYMGDDATDEDVFRTLKRGITIKIGHTKKSFARYFIKNQSQVNGILSQFLKTLCKKPQ